MKTLRLLCKMHRGIFDIDETKNTYTYMDNESCQKENIHHDDSFVWKESIGELIDQGYMEGNLELKKCLI